MDSNKSYSIMVIKNKIIQLIDDGSYKTFEQFINQNPNYKTFLINNHLDTVLSHWKGNITQTDYEQILLEFKSKYISIKPENNLNNGEPNINEQPITNTQQIPVISEINDKQKVFFKPLRTKEEIKNGFIDAAILAFVTGSFLGALFINLYIRMMQVMQ